MNCKVVSHNGVNVIDIDGKMFPPVSFKTFRACDRNISDFYKAGIRLFCVVECAIDNSLGNPYSLFGESWLDDETYDFSVTDRQIDLFIKNAPDAYLSLMISVDTRKWWLEKRKGYVNSYFELSKMEADSVWRELAAKYMQALIKHVEEKYGDKIFGYFIFCGTTTEWFSEKSYEQPSDVSLEAYRRWCGDEKTEVPDESAREAAADVVFLDGKNDCEVIKYRKFEAWQRSDTILYFAKKAHEILEHKKLLGLYFGYIFELHSPRLWNTCYLDYERVFKSPDIDMIANPISYAFRAQEDGSHGMVTDTTIAWNNKICFYEHDQTTSIVPDIIEGKPFAHPNKCDNIEDDVNLLRRDFMLGLSRGCASWWFDMFGGWFYDERFMDEIGNMVKITEKLSALPYDTDSEIAVVADPEAMYYVNKNSKLNEMLFKFQKAGLSELGAPYDLVSACDIERLDSPKYKLIIFLDQFLKNGKADETIEKLRKDKKTLLFLYAHNIVDEKGSFSISGMNASLGFTLFKNPYAEDTVVLDSGNTFQTKWKRECFAIEETDTLTVLGRYETSGKAAYGYVKQDGAVTAFAGLGMLNGDAFAPILELAGVHRYAVSNEVAIYASSQMLGVYHRQKADAIIRIKDGGCVLVDLFSDKEYVADGNSLIVPYDNSRAKLLVKKE